MFFLHCLVNKTATLNIPAVQKLSLRAAASLHHIMFFLQRNPRMYSDHLCFGWTYFSDKREFGNSVSKTVGQNYEVKKTKTTLKTCQSLCRFRSFPFLADWKCARSDIGQSVSPEICSICRLVYIPIAFLKAVLLDAIFFYYFSISIIHIQHCLSSIRSWPKEKNQTHGIKTTKLLTWRILPQFQNAQTVR